MDFSKQLVIRGWSVLKVCLRNDKVYIYGINITHHDDHYKKSAILVFTKDFRHLDTHYFEFSKISQSVISKTGFIKTEKNLFFTHGLESVIYRIDENISSFINFGFAKVGEEEYLSLNHLNGSNIMYFIGDFYPLADDKYYVSFRQKGNLISYVFNIKNRLFTPAGRNQIDNCPLLRISYGQLIAGYSKGIIHIVENDLLTSKFFAYKNDLMIHNALEYMDKLDLLSKRSVRDNPILVCWEFID